MEAVHATGSDRPDDAAGRRGSYAVGYFESWNLESLQGVVDAAEQTASPIILGFNGAFLSGPRAAPERLALYAALGRAAAESSSVPCGLIFNECPRDDWVVAAIEAGFNLVMLADPEAPHADYVARVAAITRLAHERGVAVEGELGELPCGAAAMADRRGWNSHRPGGRGRIRRRHGHRPAGRQRRQCPHSDARSARSGPAAARARFTGVCRFRWSSMAGRASRPSR